MRFGDFAKARGAKHLGELPAHLDEYVASRVAALPERDRPRERLLQYRQEIRGPVAQMLTFIGVLAVPERNVEPTFAGKAPGFFDSLREERGLRPATVNLYRYHLTRLQDHLAAANIDLAMLRATDIDSFIASAGERMSPASLTPVCCAVRHLLRWLFREGILPRDLSGGVGKPQVYRLASVPRSIPWAEVERTLGGTRLRLDEIEDVRTWGTSWLVIELRGGRRHRMWVRSAFARDVQRWILSALRQAVDQARTRSAHRAVLDASSRRALSGLRQAVQER